MRLNPISSKSGLSKLFLITATLILVCILVYQLPASSVSWILSNRTDCRVTLHQTMGTIWQGSASLGFSESKLDSNGCREPTALTDRFTWQTECSLGKMVCSSEIISSVLNSPVSIIFGFHQVQISNGDLNLPASVLEAFGNPWKTLRPRGQLTAHWDQIKKGKETAGSIRIDIRDLSSPISLVKPLGSYEIRANVTEPGIVFLLSSVNGPLLLSGKGMFNTGNDEGFHFLGNASASPGSEESLIGLLSILGKQDGELYRMQF